MVDQTAEEIKKQNIAQMGESLGAQFSQLRQELIILYVKWAEFVHLFFEKKERTELLNQAAPLYFRLTQDAQWESLILHIARLVDSATIAAKPNLTINNLPSLIDDISLKKRATDLIEIALNECKFCLDWRHKIFAHRDLNLALGNPATPVPTADKKQVDAALKALADVLNAIEHHYKNAGTLFELTSRNNGAPLLLSILEKGVRTRDNETEQLKTEQLKRATKSDRTKLKARLPRGLADRGPAEIAATRRMTDTIREVFELYGFEPLETPAIEYTDALGKFLPDQDRPNEGVFSFQDDDEQWMSLRYDLTAPLARYVAENFNTLALPYRSYRFGWVFRNEKPGPGRYRQFMQFDADTVGSSTTTADAEICMMAADTMERLGIARGQYVVKVNNRKVLDSVLESIGLGGEKNAGKRLTVLRAIDKLDRLGIEGVRQLLGKGRKDESGDFTKGAELDPERADTICRFLFAGGIQHFEPSKGSEFFVPGDEEVLEDGSHYSSINTIAGLSQFVSETKSGREAVAELESIFELTTGAGYGSKRIKFDSSVVRGLEYYTGAVYEVELLIETKDEKGRPVRFGSVGGGGRYDGLVSRFRGEPVPATGFSIGVSRLQAALTLIGKLDSKPERGPVLVTVFDRDRVADYQKMVAALRAANIRAELYLGSRNHNVGQQLKYADKRNSPCAIIQGGDELNDSAGPQVIVKDLTLGAELSKLESDRAGHLERQGEAQQKIPQAKLVEAVRAILARHGAK